MELVNKVKIDGKWVFEDSWVFKNGAKITLRKNMWVFVDKHGKASDDEPFDNVEYFSDYHPDYAIVYRDFKVGIMDGNGCMVVDFRYTVIGPMVNSMCRVKNSRGKQGFLNIDLKETIKPVYQTCTDFSANKAFVTKGDKWDVIDRSGKKISKLRFDQIRENLNFTLASVDGKFGSIDLNGDVIIPFKYSSIDKEDPGDIYAVSDARGRFGYVRAGGEELCAFEYTKAWVFEGGLGIVQKMVELAPKDDPGDAVAQEDAVVLGYPKDGPPAHFGYKWGAVNDIGEEVMPFIYATRQDCRAAFDKMPKKESIENKAFEHRLPLI